MKATQKKVIVLELNEEEAKWLRNMVQNPVLGEGIIEESSTDREMRRKFFNALTDTHKMDAIGNVTGPRDPQRRPREFA